MLTTSITKALKIQSIVTALVVLGSCLTLPATAQIPFGKPRAYLNVYPGMPQKGASAENVFGTLLSPVGGEKTAPCGRYGSIKVRPIKQPDIILNVTKASKVEIFLSEPYNSDVTLGLLIMAKNGKASACRPAPVGLLQGFSPAFAANLPVGEYGVWAACLMVGLLHRLVAYISMYMSRMALRKDETLARAGCK
jgi:hypothetical protein